MKFLPLLLLSALPLFAQLPPELRQQSPFKQPVPPHLQFRHSNDTGLPSAGVTPEMRRQRTLETYRSFRGMPRDPDFNDFPDFFRSGIDSVTIDAGSLMLPDDLRSTV